MRIRMKEPTIADRAERRRRKWRPANGLRGDLHGVGARQIYNLVKQHGINMLPAELVIGAKGRAALCEAGLADEVGEVGNAGGTLGAEAGAEIVPAAEAELGAGFHELEEGVAAARPASERVPPESLRRMTTARRSLSASKVVQRHLRAVERQQELVAICVEPRQQPVEGGKAGAGAEQPVEAVSKRGGGGRHRASGSRA